MLWWLAGDGTFNPEAREAIANPRSQVFVSSASAWEISIKKALGKLEAPDDLEDQLAHHAFASLPITVAHALEAGALPRHHEDPFDRMLIAQAQLEGLTIVTRDSRFSSYGARVLVA